MSLTASRALCAFALVVAGCERSDSSKPVAANPNTLAVVASSPGSVAATEPGGPIDPAAPALSAATTPTATPASTPLEPCTAQADRAVTIVTRPRASTEFGQLAAGDAVTIEARSKEGWLGFDPGVAQAANVGPFRLRWLDPTRVVTRGGCATVPEVWTPPPDVCFEMTMEEVVVRDAPRGDGHVLATLHRGDFAALVGRHGEWAKVDLASGNTALVGQGFIAADALNVSGDCDALLKR